MASFKQLKSSDVITLPIVANKQWDFNYNPLPDDSHIKIYNGTYITGTFCPGGEAQTEGHYDRLMYNHINQLFYHKYNDGLSTASLMSSKYYESANGARPSSSFFSYNDNPGFVNNFPTGSGANIRVISVSTDLYGQRILPNTFQVSSSTYNLRDDGNGNIYDSSTHVGNVFYSNGIAVITNPDYQSIFPLIPVANDDTYNIIRSNYPNPAVVSISPLANDLFRDNTVISQSIQLFGGDIGFFSTGSENTVSMSFSGLGVGTYQTFYTFQVTGSYSAPLTSNIGAITINVTDPECEFEVSVAQFDQIIFLSPSVGDGRIVIDLILYSGSA